MKLRNAVILTGVVVGINYYFYKKYEEQNVDNEHIDRCRYKLMSLGYKVDDSYSLNLKENPYLIFNFSNDEKNYEVKYDKVNEVIDYIREV